MKNRYLYNVFAILLFFTFGNVVQARDLKLRSYVDRARIAEGQQFTLTIEFSGSDAQAAPTPELPDFSAFADYVGSSTSQNINFVNGRMTVSKSTMNYYRARVAGKYRIPAIQMMYRGKKIQSQPVTIEIVKSSAPSSTTPGRQPGQQQGRRTPRFQITPASSLKGNIFLRAEASPRIVYQNQPILVTYKIYTRVEVANYSISKLPNMVGFWNEEFSMPQQPVTYEKVINGKRFLVAEIKKMALFPTDAGEKVIGSMEIDCEVRLQNRRRRSIFDDFFNDDFFNNSLFGRRVRTKIKSDSVKINVKPLPANGKPGDFSGAVGKFNMSASLDKNQVKANEAITLKVKFSGTGNIKMLPAPKVVFPPNIETYEPKTSTNIDRTGDRIRGNKTTEYVLIPRYAGDYRIKPITFNYFDTASGTYKTLSSPEFSIHVSAGAGTGLPMTSGISREEVKLIGRDIRFIRNSTDKFYRIGGYFYRSFWFVLLLIFPVLIFTGVVVYQQRQEKMVENVAYARSRKANQMAKKRLGQVHKLKKTGTQKEFYAEISHALLGFIADKLNLAAAGLISDEVADKLKARHVSENVISELLSCLQECDFQRFAPAETDDENMKQLYKRAQQAIVDLDKAKLS